MRSVRRKKKTGSFSLIERVILSAGAMLIFSVSFQIDQMPEGTWKDIRVVYMPPRGGLVHCDWSARRWRGTSKCPGTQNVLAHKMSWHTKCPGTHCQLGIMLQYFHAGRDGDRKIERGSLMILHCIRRRDLRFSVSERVGPGAEIYGYPLLVKVMKRYPS